MCIDAHFVQNSGLVYKIYKTFYSILWTLCNQHFEFSELSRSKTCGYQAEKRQIQKASGQVVRGEHQVQLREKDPVRLRSKRVVLQRFVLKYLPQSIKIRISKN